MAEAAGHNLHIVTAKLISLFFDYALRIQINNIICGMENRPLINGAEVSAAHAGVV